MSTIRIVMGMLLVGLMILGASIVFGQEYPTKTVRIMTGSAGGSSDFISRLVAQGISGPLGQPVIVENRTAFLAAEVASKAPPDGYTLLINSGTWYISTLLQKLSYDPIKDFSPIAIIHASPSVLVVHPSLPVKSVKELIALAKAKPGALNYSSSVAGSGSHLAGELFKSLSGANIVVVAYRGSPAAITALLTGEGQLTFGDGSPITTHLTSGRLKGLAVTSAKPSALFPGLPTVAEAVPGYEMVAIMGAFAPIKTPVAVINRLNREIVRAINTAEVKAKVFSTGSEVITSSPEDLASWVKADMARWGKVIQDAHIKGE